jgi:hypothetical protein
LREGRRLRAFQNRVQREIFGTKMDEVTGEWRKLHDKKLYDLYCYLRIIGIIKWMMGRACGMYGYGNKLVESLAGSLEQKRALGRPMSR